MIDLKLIRPDWPAPLQVNSLVTTRHGGVSESPYASLNLGEHVGDLTQAVEANRSILRASLPSDPLWLKQVHGTNVSTPDNRTILSTQGIEADAAVTNIPNEVLVILTADCLPVFFSNQAGDVVGIAHAGWRGLCAGILENTVGELLHLCPNLAPNQLLAWLGPAIGPESFEVGEDVYGAFTDAGIAFPHNAFIPISDRPGKYHANLYLLAKSRLESLGVERISGGNLCTVKDQNRFFSHRRDAISGRFASLIWFT